MKFREKKSLFIVKIAGNTNTLCGQNSDFFAGVADTCSYTVLQTQKLLDTPHTPVCVNSLQQFGALTRIRDAVQGGN
jgi:hypothetical protein